MQKLTQSELNNAYRLLKLDRQWRRSERLAKARSDLRWAYRKDPTWVNIFKFIVRRLDYDWIDKANASVR